MSRAPFPLRAAAALRGALVAGATSIVLGWGALSVPGIALAKEAESVAQDPALEARMVAIASQLRCLVCQNQTVADSHSGLADDLRQQIRAMLVQGRSDQEIYDFMTDRYGDFVLYRPPFKATTALLWIGPGVLAVVALLVLGRVLLQRQRLGPEAFDADEPDDDDEFQSRDAEAANR